MTSLPASLTARTPSLKLMPSRVLAGSLNLKAIRVAGEVVARRNESDVGLLQLFQSVALVVLLWRTAVCRSVACDPAVMGAPDTCGGESIQWCVLSLCPGVMKADAVATGGSSRLEWLPVASAPECAPLTWRVQVFLPKNLTFVDLEQGFLCLCHAMDEEKR